MLRQDSALGESEQLLELFFSQSLDGFFFMMLDEPVRWDDSVDKPATLEYAFSHQRITKVNDGMLAQYGATREQLIGLTPGAFYAHNLEYGKEVWRRFFDAGRLHTETDERRFDGTPIRIEGDYICLYTSDGRIAGHFGIQRNVTERYHVYALDLRGHGDSDRPASGYTMRDLAADVIAFMDAKRVRRATVVGHSMGSFVAQQVTLAAPDRVARLDLIGSGRSIHRFPGIAELEAAVDSLPDPVPLDFVSAFQTSTVHRPLPAEFMEQVNRESLKLPARVWRGLMKGMLATQPANKLAGLRIPTLMLWGDRDAMFSRAEQDALLGMLPHAMLKVFPETGHAPHWERPSELARDLEVFVGGTT